MKFPILEIPKLTDEDKILLAEIYKNPTVIKHFRIIGLNAINDSAHTALLYSDNTEEYARKQVHFKAVIQTVEQLLLLAEVVSKPVAETEAVQTPQPNQ